MRNVTRLITGFAALAAISIVGAGPASALDKVVLRINFTPWAMHSQYYAAKAQGFYAEQGIDVDIRPVASGQTVEALVAGGEPFGLDNADAFVKAKAANLPIIAIMADQPNTPTAVITLKKSNITKPGGSEGQENLVVSGQRQGSTGSAAGERRPDTRRYRIRQRDPWFGSSTPGRR